MSERALGAIALALLAAVLGVAALKLRPLLHPEPDLIALPDPGCNLAAGPCTARFPGGGEATLDIAPRGIPPLAPLQIAVRLKGIEAGAVQVDFAGVDMEMGYNRRSLEASGAGAYRGQGMLPACVRERMDWEARVLIETPRGLFAAPFRFASQRSH